MLYKITADYRPKNPCKPTYYVVADSKKQARAKFSDLISWLKIYDVEEVVDGETEILAAPEKNIIIE